MGRAENFSIKYRDPKISVFSHSAGLPVTEMLRFALLLVSLGLGAPHPAREGRVIDSGSDEATWGEECLNPCSGEECNKVAKIMEHLVDFTVDPCDDFFAFSCSAKTRGRKFPFPSRKIIDKKEDLVRDPPKKFEYMRKFYHSCTKINTRFTTEEVFEKCVEADGPGGEKCTKVELEEYGDIYVQMFGYIQQFFKETAFPAVTSDWEEATKDWFGGAGWTWDGVAAKVLKDYFYLGAFNEIETNRKPNGAKFKTENFKSNVFFAPMINSVSFNAEFNDGDIHEIYIVPMTIPSRLGRLTKAPGYKKLMVNILKSFGGNASTVEADASRILEMEEKLVEIGLNSLLSRQDFLGNNGEFRQMTIRKLAESVPEVPWISYIEAALDHNPSVKIRPSTLVHIPDISKMKALGRMVEKLSVRDRANLLVWRMFVKFANDFLNTGSESDGLQENPWHGRDRKEVCLNQIDAFFPNAYGGSMLLGHEMVHGFDDRGRVYDKDGLKFNWWKPSEVTEYNKRTQCLVEQYQNFSISYEGEDYSKSRAAAAGENIADNGGSKAAYEAYKKLPDAEKQCVPGFNFTSDQLYWLGYSFFWCTIDHEHENIGDYRRILERTPSLPGHFPAPWRVNTVFSNQPQFAEAFQCPQGSRLNPGEEERCAVW